MLDRNEPEHPTTTLPQVYKINKTWSINKYFVMHGSSTRYCFSLVDTHFAKMCVYLNLIKMNDGVRCSF